MSILMALVVGVASMLRSSIDVKQALARESRITHRLSLAINKITRDVEQAFITGLNDEHRGGANRRFKTIFKIDKSGGSDKLYLTVSGQLPNRKDSQQTDAQFIVYEVRDARDSPGRKHLYRGTSPLVLDDLKADPQNMRVFVRNIKSFKLRPWRGDDWSDDRWDSSRGEWRDKLPQMVRIEIETLAKDDNEAPQPGDPPESGVESVKSIVRLQNARFMKEIKDINSSVRWY